MTFDEITRCYDEGYREFSDVITKGQAQELAYEKNTGCVWWPKRGVFEFMPNVYKPDPWCPRAYWDPVVVRATV